MYDEEEERPHKKFEEDFELPFAAEQVGENLSPGVCVQKDIKILWRGAQ